MTFFARIAILISTAYITACASPAYFAVPNQRLDSPTVGGKMWKGNVGGAITAPTYVVTVKDVDATPPSSSGTTITRDPEDFTFLDAVHVDIRLGLGSRFEISNVGPMTHAKFQFLGSSRAEAAPNEWVGSITADILTIDNENSTGDGTIADARVEGDGLGASLILGYRTDTPWIYYVNINYLDFNAETTVDQSGTEFKYKGDGRQVGAALGARFEKERGFYMIGEWAYSKTNWSGANESELGSFGGALGWAW